MAKRVSGFHTNQPYIEYGRYVLDNGAEVLIKFGGMRSTWDCQPFRAPSRIIEGPKDQSVIAELQASFPNSVFMAELLAE